MRVCASRIWHEITLRDWHTIKHQLINNLCLGDWEGRSVKQKVREIESVCECMHDRERERERERERLIHDVEFKLILTEMKSSFLNEEPVLTREVVRYTDNKEADKWKLLAKWRISEEKREKTSRLLISF